MLHTTTKWFRNNFEPIGNNISNFSTDISDNLTC